MRSKNPTEQSGVGDGETAQRAVERCVVCEVDLAKAIARAEGWYGEFWPKDQVEVNSSNDGGCHRGRRGTAEDDEGHDIRRGTR